jgi:hypothetical protein
MFTPGTIVRLKDELTMRMWFVTEATGIVKSSRQFGPTESMVTVMFGNKCIHTSSTNLVIVPL